MDQEEILFFVMVQMHFFRWSIQMPGNLSINGSVCAKLKIILILYACALSPNQKVAPTKRCFKLFISKDERLIESPVTWSRSLVDRAQFKSSFFFHSDRYRKNVSARRSYGKRIEYGKWMRRWFSCPEPGEAKSRFRCNSRFAQLFFPLKYATRS